MMIGLTVRRTCSERKRAMPLTRFVEGSGPNPWPVTNSRRGRFLCNFWKVQERRDNPPRIESGLEIESRQLDFRRLRLVRSCTGRCTMAVTTFPVRWTAVSIRCTLSLAPSSSPPILAIIIAWPEATTDHSTRSCLIRKPCLFARLPVFDQSVTNFTSSVRSRFKSAKSIR